MSNIEMTQIDHTNYPKQLKGRSISSLRYTINDCKAAIAAMPNGHKVGYYTDEIHYCSMEITRQLKAKK